MSPGLSTTPAAGPTMNEHYKIHAEAVERLIAEKDSVVTGVVITSAKSDLLRR